MHVRKAGMLPYLTVAARRLVVAAASWWYFWVVTLTQAATERKGPGNGPLSMSGSEKFPSRNFSARPIH